MFIKYMHIKRIGKTDVDGLLQGTCYVFPKIDGANASVWQVDGEIKAASRRHEVSLENDYAGFYAWLVSSEIGEHIKACLEAYPSWMLYGEWLVSHSLKTYRKDAWRRFYVFDVYDREAETFLSYDEYEPSMRQFVIDFIPVMEIVDNPTEAHLVGLLEKNTFLIEDGKGFGEGIVIKRYDFVNRYGRTTWAKLVRNEFKEKNAEVFGVPKVKMSGGLETKLAQQYVTPGRVEKIVAKMLDAAPWTPRRIPELFSRVWHDVIEEEMWDIVKKHKNPIVDFKQFYSAVVRQIKAARPELF